jgi:nucleoside-diphosphate-sugar epimerase
MRILLTGANGYIGMRLLPVLVEAGHDVTCVVRESMRFQPKPDILKKVSIIDFDFLNRNQLEKTFSGEEFDVGYYLIHSLKDTFIALEEHEKG